MEIQIWAWGIGASVLKLAVPGLCTGVVLLSVRDAGIKKDYRIDAVGQQLDIATEAVFMTHYLSVPDSCKEQLHKLHDCTVRIKSSQKVMLGTGTTEISVTVHPRNKKPMEILSSEVDEAMGILMPAFSILGKAKTFLDNGSKKKAVAKLSGPSSATLVG
jgi:hypothetical protein